MGKSHVTALGLLLVALLVFSCTPKVSSPTPVVTPSAPSSVTAQPAVQAPAKAAWEENWEATLNGAKKEGKVVIALNAGGEVRGALIRGFKQRYGIAMEAISGRGAELAEKVMSERRAGIYTFDLYNGGTTTIVNTLIPARVFDSLEPTLMLPEVTDLKLWWKGEMDWVDKEHTALSFLAFPKAPVGINTELVKPGEIKSYKDLLNPKWKGKMSMNDPTVTGSGAKFPGVIGGAIMGWDYIRELAKQEPAIVRDERLQVEWLAKGKYPIAINPGDIPFAEVKNAGASIEWLTPQEGTYVTSGYGAIALLKGAPHPSAAKLFINWLLTKEGQTMFSVAGGMQSGRVDVPTDHLQPQIVRDPKMKYFDSYSMDFTLQQPEHIKMSKEIFGPLMK